MAIEVKVPVLGESVTEATIAKWFKAPGDAVALDEAIVELETDKVTVEVNAPVAGALISIEVAEGTDVEVGALLAMIDEGASGTTSAAAPAAAAPAAPVETPAPAATPAPAVAKPAPVTPAAASSHPLSPAVRKLVDDNSLNAAMISGTGKDGRLTKADVQTAITAGTAKQGAAPSAPAGMMMAPSAPLPPRPDDPREERVRMSKLRKTIASRLKIAQNTAAMLTTWNEIDMGAAMEMRAEFKDAFEKRHGVRLGFMSIFVRAAINALKEWPAVNSEIYGDELIYKNYYNIGVAVGTPKGLVVPVLRDADKMSFADIEGTLGDFGRRARDGKLGVDDMSGGTFTISNGGVFGSLNSMPILNAPQSGILGMHNIVKRAVVVGDEIVIRPMMNVALSYDHRIIDGREAVSFLVRLKQCVEDPKRLLIDV